MGFEHLWHDVRLACRSLGRARGFAVAAVFTLAVGIAGVTAVFALVQGVLLRPLPVPEQQRLIIAWQELRSAGLAHFPFRAPEIDRLSQSSRTLESVAGIGYNGAMELTFRRSTARYLPPPMASRPISALLG